MIPSGYKEDVVYSQIPTNGNGDLSFTRASNGTRVNSAGLVEVVPWNLAILSEDFTDPAWFKSSVTITGNATTSPNGTTTADKIAEDSTNDFHITGINTNIVSGQQYTLSFYAKASERNFARILAGSPPFASVYAYFDLVNGTTTTNATSSAIESIGSSWYRCSMTLTATSTSSGVSMWFGPARNMTDTYSGYQGISGNGIFGWGAQINLGTLKPYFPTTDRLNVPRLTYQNGGGGCPSLLLEKQSTNLQLYSEDFRNVAEGGATNTWTPNDTIILSTNNTAPDGTLSATRIRGNGSNRARQAVIFGTIGAPYSGSIFIRRVSGTATIELRVGDVSQVSTINPTSDWQRFTYTASPTSTAIRLAVVFSNNTDEFEIWGAQLEASSYPTSYIPTTSSSATRVADACSKTGISSLIGQTEGTLFLQFEFNYSDSTTQVLMKANETNDANSVGIEVQGTTIKGLVNSAGSNIATITGTISTGTIKAALAYKTNDIALYVNGSQIGVDTSGSIAFGGAVDILTIGQFLLFGTSYFQSTRPFSEAVLFKTRLTNAELASLTTI